MVAVGGDEGDVVVFGVVFIDIHHDGLVAEGLFLAFDFHFAEGVPAIDGVAFLLLLVGIDEVVDPVAEGYVVGFGGECQAEAIVFGFDGDDFLFADVGEVVVGFL